MAKLTSNAVRALVMDCLFPDGPSTIPYPHIKVDGILASYFFDPPKIDKNRETIIELLDELSDNFKEDSGGGWSFLNACEDKHSNHWAEHPTMEALFCLGMAIGKVTWLLPRDMWSALPGSMPYVVVLTNPFEVSIVTELDKASDAA